MCGGDTTASWPSHPCVSLRGQNAAQRNVVFLTGSGNRRSFGVNETFLWLFALGMALLVKECAVTIVVGLRSYTRCLVFKLRRGYRGSGPSPPCLQSAWQMFCSVSNRLESVRFLSALLRVAFLLARTIVNGGSRFKSKQRGG